MRVVNARACPRATRVDSFFEAMFLSKPICSMYDIFARVSMEVSNQLVSWFTTYLRDLQPVYKGVIIHFLSTMDIPVPTFTHKFKPFMQVNIPFPWILWEGLFFASTSVTNCAFNSSRTASANIFVRLSRIFFK